MGTTTKEEAEAILDELGHRNPDTHGFIVSRGGNKYKKQPDRIVVRVSPLVWEVIEPLFNERKGAPYIDRVACDLNLHETMRLLAEEPQAELGVRNHQLYITPSEQLTARARRLYVGPHILCRAAAVKIMQAMTKGYIHKMTPGPARGEGGRPRKNFGAPLPEPFNPEPEPVVDERYPDLEVLIEVDEGEEVEL